MVRCVGAHPQLPLRGGAARVEEALALVDELAREGRLDGVGEAGFDLYDAAFRETEAAQEKIFAAHLETALAYGLPLTIHARRAMGKIFPLTGRLRRLKAVVFHSWSGTLADGEALLRRGVNAYFSFGAALVNGHKEARRCCALLPLDRILLETDAPYQPIRGREISTWDDLVDIAAEAAALRGAPVDAVTTANFARVYGLDGAAAGALD